jgi:hypothetical protein
MPPHVTLNHNNPVPMTGKFATIIQASLKLQLVKAAQSRKPSAVHQSQQALFVLQSVPFIITE